MALDTYQCKPIVLPSHDLSFSFESCGPNGEIKKVIQFQPFDQSINGETVVNLSFGDWNEENANVNDQSISDNRDTQKILATVAMTTLQYLEQNDSRMIYITGSTPARTRLYQIALNKNRAIWEKLFQAFGLLNDCWQRFIEGSNYEAFLFVRK
ncbi:DUF6934 family protein [Chitinophaga caseinilytica]|uniref:DUF695 domain-containing protein n=1 Tax=Chitinophaga caseinilytica TaxID=2267521 RepID=A0ABZ2Z3V6_9BACT